MRGTDGIVAAPGWLIRGRLRRHWYNALPLALIIGFGATAALLAVGAANRTAEAYRGYLDRSNVGDVTLNPSFPTTEIDGAIRGLPGVVTATRDVMFFAGLDTDPTAAVTEEVRGSLDGRFLTMDRPTVKAGRLPTGRNEAIVDTEVAARRRIKVGDVVPVYFADARTEFVPPSGSLAFTEERLQVVGIVTFAHEVLPEQLYPRGVVVVSQDVAARHDCLTSAPPKTATWKQVLDLNIPVGCSAQNNYYSLRLAARAAGVPAALDAYDRKSADLSAQLPVLTDDPEFPQPENIAYHKLTTTTRDEQRRVEHSVRPAVVTLGVLGLAAGALTIILAAIAVARELRRTDTDQRQWWQLGMRTFDRLRVVATPLLLAIAAGLVGAVAAGWWLSPLAPVGSVRAVDPSPAREVSSVAWLGLLALGVALVVAVVVLAWRQARRAAAFDGAGAVSPSGRTLVSGRSRPEVDAGIRAAFGGRRAPLVITGGAATVAVFLTSVVFGASLSRLVSTPQAYGWSWDLGVIYNYGYGGYDRGAAASALRARRDVVGWSELALTPVTLKGSPTSAVIALDGPSAVRPTMLEGRRPVADDEVALGARTASERGLGVGDHVSVGGDNFETRTATVTGIVVLPALGPFQASRAGPGTGVLLPPTMFDPAVLDQQAAFLGIDLVPEADPVAVEAELHDTFLVWNKTDQPPFSYVDAVQPPEIVDARSMRAFPAIVSGLLEVAAVVMLSTTIALSVRARRRELAVLRALGFTGRQLRWSVRIQAGATTVAAVIFGVPLGILAGRTTWRAFASELGVLPALSLPGWGIAVAVVAPLLVALAAAAVPARWASRIHPAAALRSE